MNSLPTEDASDLSVLVRSCNDVEEFRNILQDRGIWLNRNAAESAFYSLRYESDQEELDDAALSSVVGGISSYVNDLELLTEIISRM